MRICKVCGYELEKNEMVCPFCNTPYSESSEKKTETTQSDKPLTELMKFVEFMDDDLLLKTAECKLAGIGVSKNEEEAIMLFKVLAFRGNLDGMYKFAEMCQKMGDKESAIKWLKAAADGGHKPSKIKLKMEYGEDIKINQNISLDNSTIANGFASIVKAVMPNIVMVQATGKVKGQQYNYIGSGFIIEGNYIVTNAHVIGTNPNQITVRFESSIDEKTYMVKPVYVESGYDLAILEFTGLAKNKFSGLEHLTLRLDPTFGEEAYTVGNPKGFDFSVSKCVISNPKREYKYRDVDEVIQIDMTVNPGNSGGALLDMNNNVLGVITFYPGGINGGIAMCIPSKYIVNILNKL